MVAVVEHTAHAQVVEGGIAYVDLGGAVAVGLVQQYMQGALPENELAASPAPGRICVGAGDGPQTAGIEVEPLAGCQNGAVAPVLATSRRSTHFHHAFQQIGRASCRERVCQYV